MENERKALRGLRKRKRFARFCDIKLFLEKNSFWICTVGLCTISCVYFLNNFRYIGATEILGYEI